MTRKILRAILLAVTLVLVASFAVSTLVLYSYFGKVQTEQLRGELSLAAAGTEKYGLAYLNELKEDSFRLTWVGADGRVLFDSVADAAAMENHLQREEIRQALETGSGSSVRTSDTLTEKTLYAELSEIVAGKKTGRENDDERILFWHRGLSINDIALGRLYYKKAVANNIGTKLFYR